MTTRLAAFSRSCLGALAAFSAASLSAQTYGPPSPSFDGGFRPAVARQAEVSATTDVDQRRLAVAAGRLAPQRPGTTDAYVIAVALDSDPVFAREARESARVLAERYDAAGRTLLLAGADGRDIDPLPRGSPATLEDAILRVARMMNPDEDALILYITAHGTPQGIAYRDQGQLLSVLPPQWLQDVFRRARIRNRLVIVSACFSGLFVPAMTTPDGAVVTAAAADRTSFGCASDNDWTFFGDALVNHAFRKSQPLATAFGEARGLIASWEARGHLIPSNPQIAIGAHAASWLVPLEARIPKAATLPVGRPAVDAIDQAIAANH